MKAASIAITLLAVAFVFLLPHFGLIAFPFYYVIPVLLFIWLYLTISNETFADIGFSFGSFQWKAVVTGLVTAVILFLFMEYIFFPFLNKIAHVRPANLSDFKNIRHHFFNYTFILIASFIVGGIYEEIVFHGFIFTRLEKILRGNHALVISFIITNLLFGIYHFQLGLSGMINATVAGCIYHFAMLKFKRNLWYAVFIHTFFDVIGLTYIYLGYW